MASLGPLIGIGRTAEIYAWGEHEILKLFRQDWPSRAIEMEVRVCRAVYAAGVASPAVGELVQVNGRTGLVFERISGPTMLQAMAARPWTARAQARSLADLHAAIHGLPCPELDSLSELLKRRISQAARLSDDLKTRLLEKLAKMPDGKALCHYDFHPGNILVSPHGPLIIDWMSAACGNPVADVARTTLLFQMGRLPQGTPLPERIAVQTLRSVFLSVYQSRYSRIRQINWDEVKAWIPILAAARLMENIPAEEDLLLKIASSV